MPDSNPRVSFHDYLPELFRAAEQGGVSFLSTFLTSFEAAFEELQGEIEGAPDRTHGGIPDLFDPAVTPPPEFLHRPGGGSAADFTFLSYLAGWIGLPLRPEKSMDWNRAFFQAAVPLLPWRGTRKGLDGLLRAWLRDELLENISPNPPPTIVSDLTPNALDAPSLFQIQDAGPTVQLGVDSVSGEGPPFFFVVDLVLRPGVDGISTLDGVDRFQRAARDLLDAEKPCHTYYQLRVRARLAPEGPFEVWTYDSEA